MFLSKCLLNTSESISFGHCLCGSTSTAFFTRPLWSFDKPHQSDRICPKVPLQDLLRQLSFFILIIVTQSSQVYQLTRSSVTANPEQCGTAFYKKRRKRDHLTPLLKLKELRWLPMEFHCQYKIATLAYCQFEGSLPPYRSSSLCTCEPSWSL